MLVPKDKAWDSFMEGINSFTPDYFEAIEARENDTIDSEREKL